MVNFSSFSTVKTIFLKSNYIVDYIEPIKVSLDDKGYFYKLVIWQFIIINIIYRLKKNS